MAKTGIEKFATDRGLAQIDAEGYITYVGRADDVFKASDSRISPFELESVLIEHPAVAEAAVIGKPDAERGQIVKAFVRLAASAAAGAELSEALKSHVRDRLAAYKAPREIEFVPGFEMTSSGKINRKALRAREMADSDLT